MNISQVALYKLTMPLHRPYKLSGGRLRFTELDSTFVRIETDTGLVGWGEGCPWGHTYLPAHGDGIRAAAEVLAPELGSRIEDGCASAPPGPGLGVDPDPSVLGEPVAVFVKRGRSYLG